MNRSDLLAKVDSLTKVKIVKPRIGTHISKSFTRLLVEKEQ